MSARPLVILGGWLGCQRRFLRRYELLYKSLGFDVFSYVPEPHFVVDSCLKARPIQVPEGWPAQLPGNAKSMQDMAWDVLGRIYNGQSSVFLFHSFSNGGCFAFALRFVHGALRARALRTARCAIESAARNEVEGRTACRTGE